MKIICVGRNYREHAKELNNPVPSKPVIFIKPDTAILKPKENFYHPDFSDEIHYECELVYRVSREGKNIQEKFALSYLDGIGLGIDFTARDLQEEAKSKRLPWTLAKAFNGSAPVSEFLPVNDFPNLHNITFTFLLNGETRQKGYSKDMIFSIESLVSFISRYMTLKTGDLIFTGTPAGVNKVQTGDHLEAYLENIKMLDFYVK